MDKQNPLWISEGDPTGISYELLQKSYFKLNELAKNRPIILVKSQNSINCEGFEKLIPEKSLPKNGIFYVNSEYTNQFESIKFKLGNPDSNSGLSSYLSLKYSCKLIKEYGGNLITLPLSKEWIIKSGQKKFRGHTEFLASYFKCNTYMIMYSDTWKVLVLTTHIPIGKIISNLKKIKWKKLFSAIKDSKLFPNPIIGFCGINPHAGEGGKIGDEEIKILKPIIKKYTNEKRKLEGPFSADSMFTEEWKNRFTLIFSCYHDQGLIPFKALVGKSGVNLTIGLPFIRVSPDHGPAFEIAGKNLANPESLLNCLKYS